MKAYINYLYREITQENYNDENGVERIRRTVVNNSQKVFNEYRFELEFDLTGTDHFVWETNAEGKRLIKAAMVSIYENHYMDKIGPLRYPVETETEANCIAVRFDDESDNYGVESYLQSLNGGWRYYNFPAFGKRRMQGTNSGTIDPRTIIDGLLENEEICSHFKCFSIILNDEEWIFDSPKKEGTILRCGEIRIRRGANEEIIISEPEFAFPYPNSFEKEGIINEECISGTPPFAFVTKGKYTREDAVTKIECSIHRQYAADQKVFYYLTGSYSECVMEKEEGEILGIESSYVYEGDFVPVSYRRGQEGKDCLSLQPLCAFKKEYDPSIALERVFTCYSDCQSLYEGNLQKPIDDFVKAFHDDDSSTLEEYTKATQAAYSLAEKEARLHFFCSHPDVKSLENQLFSDLNHKAVEFGHSPVDKDGFENWMVTYDMENLVIFVSFYSTDFQKDGIHIKRISIRSKITKFIADMDVADCNIIAVHDINSGEEPELDSFLKDEENDIYGMDRVQDVIGYFNGDLVRILKAGKSSEKIEQRKHGTETESFDKIKEKQAKSEEQSVESKEQPAESEEKPTKDKENRLDDWTLRDKKLGILGQALSNYKNENLSYSKNTLHEIALSLGDWVSVMEEADKEGKNVSDYIKVLSKNKSKTIPIVPNLTIMGEAGTGKTLLAGQLAEKCFGAEFKSVLGSDLKSGYKNWTKVTMAALFFNLQRNLADYTPAVLFLDEAYTLFEQNKNQDGGDGVGDAVNFILKLTEPGEYPIDISEVEEKHLVKAGLVFNVTDPENYSDERLYTVDKNKVTVKAVLKRPNTAIWMGGYENRLLMSFSANEGLGRRFPARITIPTPKMTELIRQFKIRTAECISLSSKSEKEVKTFLLWATSRSRSHIFGNYAGIRELFRRCKAELNLGADDDTAVSNAILRYKNDIEKQYKTELMKELPQLPFEVVTDVDITLKSYAGNNALKRQIENILDIMLCREEYDKRNISLPKGALLMGPPGTGKTMIAKCMAGELQIRINEQALDSSDSPDSKQKDVVFIPTSGAEILATPNPVKAISALFSEAVAYDSAIIFIDEIDAIGKQRDLPGSHPGSLLQLMKELDGFGSGGNVFVLAATNDSDILDPALVRDNRFDIRLEVGLPDKASSISLIQFYLKEYGVKFDELTKKQKNRILTYLGGRAPASIKANMNAAVILYHQNEEIMLNVSDEEITEKYGVELDHRRNETGKYLRSKDYKKGEVSILDFDLFLADLKETLDIKEFGRRTNSDSEEKFNIDPDSNGSSSSVAIHEVGHAIVGYVVGRNNYEKITILGRGEAAGYVEKKRNEYRLITKKDYLDEIKLCMGGRVAEEIIYGPGNISIGASADIQQASHTARCMVDLFGFSKEVGFMAVEKVKRGYLESSYEYLVSEEMRNLADRERHRILAECFEETRLILTERKDLLIKIAKEVFEQKELSGEEMEKIFRQSIESRQ